MVLFKYLPREYAERFVHQGEMLFRSLSYFRKLEHAERGDASEGVHVDAPDTPVLLENLTTGTSVSGQFRFLNSVNQQSVFAYCLSTELRQDLFDRFECDACVRILRPGPLFMRLALAAPWKFRLDEPGVIHRSVEYFDPAHSAVRDVKDPRNLPFFKHTSFSDQREYRIVFARRGGFTLQERIVAPEFEFADEIRSATAAECLLRVGSLKAVAEVVVAGRLSTGTASAA